MSEIAALQKQAHFTTLISYESPSKYLVDMLKKKFGIRIYVLPKIEEDTSGWGYLRFIEKRINTFIQAFDTFD